MARIGTIVGLAGLTALLASPAAASPAPLRSGAALPATSHADLTVARRAGAPVSHGSDLAGFPIAALVGLFVTIIVVVVVATSGGRSPG